MDRRTTWISPSFVAAIIAGSPEPSGEPERGARAEHLGNGIRRTSVVGRDRVASSPPVGLTDLNCNLLATVSKTSEFDRNALKSATPDGQFVPCRHRHNRACIRRQIVIPLLRRQRATEIITVRRGPMSCLAYLV